jgi:run domain Beclin-1 interacting cysteine-rich containing protein
MRLRGTIEWAPPRPQIIFTIHPPPNLQNLIEVQKYRCAGCGMKVEPKYAGIFRYCNYLGRYFCTGCHTLKKARLPQMILQKWDFSPYSVSNFSATLLESLQSDPVYNVMAINPNLARKSKICSFRQVRIQLKFLTEYLKNCKSAVELYEELDKFPAYYTKEVDLYSLEDLIQLRFLTGLPMKAQEIVNKSIRHVLNCELCNQLGFHCEVCKRNEVLFPFQVTKVSRCSKCSSCFHLRCFNPRVRECPKCLRLLVRRNTPVYERAIEV